VKIISFEGIEGVGKSTQIELLKNFLEKNSKSVEVFREPGSTLSGEKIRDILLDDQYELSSKTELLLMFSARSELVNKKINNSTADYLLLDRFFDASLAYQGYGRNLSIELINKLVDFIDCPLPDLSFLIDISVEEGFARKINDKIDRIESSGYDFFNKVRNGYLEIAKNNEERFIIINGSKTVDEIHNNIIQNINI
jgi:dTMP kinase